MIMIFSKKSFHQIEIHMIHVKCNIVDTKIIITMMNMMNDILDQNQIIIVFLMIGNVWR